MNMVGRRMVTNVMVRLALPWRCVGPFRCYSSSLSSRLEKVTKDIRECKFYPRTSGDPSCLEEASSSQSVVPVLVGWAAASRRALAKYTTVYTKLGLATVCLWPTLFQMWFSSQGNELTNRFLCSISEAARDDEPLPLLLHAFSGAPTIILPPLVKCLDNHPKLRLVGVVFDSGPAPFTYKSGMAAARESYEQGGLNLLGYWASCTVGIGTEAVIGRKKRANDAKALASPVLDVPQLYLYSEMDRVAPVTHVEEVMEKQRKMGRMVQGVRWKASKHVRHLIDHPEEYEQNLSDFILQLKVQK